MRAVARPAYVDLAGVELQTCWRNAGPAFPLRNANRDNSAHWKFTHALVHEVALWRLVGHESGASRPRIARHGMQNRENPTGRGRRKPREPCFQRGALEEAVTYWQAGDTEGELSAYQEAGASSNGAAGRSAVPQETTHSKGIDVRLSCDRYSEQ